MEGQTRSTNPWRRHLFLVIKCLVACALLYLVLRKQDFAKIRIAVASIRPLWAALGIAAMLLMNFVNVVRWKMVTDAMGLPATFFVLCRAYWAGLFASNFLPSVFGGDLIRVFVVTKDKSSIFNAGISVFIDRVFALYSLLLLPVICSIPATIELPYFNRRLVWIGGILLLIPPLVLVTGLWMRLICTLNLNKLALGRKLILLSHYVHARRSQFLLIMLVSMVPQILLILIHWLFMQSLGQSLSFWAVGYSTSIATIGVMLPITINGIGLRESLLVLYMGAIGMPREEALILSLIIFVSFTLISLGGVTAVYKK